MIFISAVLLDILVRFKNCSVSLHDAASYLKQAGHVTPYTTSADIFCDKLLYWHILKTPH